MDPIVIGIIGLIFFLLLIAIGVHIGISLGFVGVFGSVFIYAQNQSFLRSLSIGKSLLLNTVFCTATEWTFVVLPLFILMGILASESGITDSAYGSIAKWFGRKKGSLAYATVLAQTAFGICTGSSIVACTVFAKVSAPKMINYGYDKKFTYGLIAGTGSLGMLIPPSVLAILYGLLSRESISKLFLAGIGPGILLAIIFMLSILVIQIRWPEAFPKIDLKADLKDKLRSLFGLIPIIILGFVIVYGILKGIFTPTEAGAIGSVTVIIIGFILKRWNVKIFMKTLLSAASSTGMVFIIFIMAKMFSRFLNLSGIAPKLINFVGNLPLPPIVIVIGFVIVYLIMGMFLDGISILIITVPISVPIIQRLNIDLIWFALITILSIECGLLTPPVGLNVYAVKGVAGDQLSLEEAFSGSFIFFLAMVLAVVLIIIFPQIVTWLPNMMVQR